MEVIVHSQNLEYTPYLKNLVDERISKAVKNTDRVTQVVVYLSVSPHHNKGNCEVTVNVHVPGETLSVTKTAATIQDAIFAAGEAAERRVENFFEVQKTRSHRRKGNGRIEV